ncbi:MAG: Glu-tRNA(Gln) amidotransferase subunit GatE [Nanoarchaeota archaeon]
MNINYGDMGFKAGLEIHQQLDSKKLFCNCPSILRGDTPSFEIKRKLHTVAGESGEIDVAAEHEAALDREFVYQAYDTTCLVELDEEPPHEINKDALMTALHISLLMNAKIIPISQIMRKTVIDGSNTGGFQRTVMIARDGFIETSYGNVRILGIFLEEDSARLVLKDEKSAVYRLDRLGIPLIEIATEPDLKNAEHAKETALKIGEILRACKVKRGIGTIRQDINISIKGSNRVELKGFQDPKIMLKSIEEEVRRQLAYVGAGKKNSSEVRNVLPNGSSEFMRPMPGADRMYPETDLPLLKIPLDFINSAKKNLPRLREEIEEELRNQGLSQEYISILLKSNEIEKYKELYYIVPKPNFVAKAVLVFPKEIAAKKGIAFERVLEILDEHYFEVFNKVAQGKLKEEDVKHIFERLVDGKSFSEAAKLDKLSVNDLEEAVLKIMKSKPGLSENAYMGLVMRELRGKISGKEASEIIKKLMH